MVRTYIILQTKLNSRGWIHIAVICITGASSQEATGSLVEAVNAALSAGDIPVSDHRSHYQSSIVLITARYYRQIISLDSVNWCRV